MTKKIAMLQPNYIPWKGVFDLINQVDVFVFYDDVQYTKRDWRNRNVIKTPQGDLWLTVPVKNNGKQLICDVEIDNESGWQKKHLKAIQVNYSKAKYFSEFEFLLDEIYVKHTWDKISELDIFATKLLANTLDINAEWVKSSDLQISGNKDGEKVISICKELGCNYFINGPASKGFMDNEKFENAKITLDFIEYNYPVYPQVYNPFNHYVSVLDLIFNCGHESKKFICT